MRVGMMRTTRAGIALAGVTLACLLAGSVVGAQAQSETAQSEMAQSDAGHPGSQPSSERASNTGADSGAPQVAPALPVPSLGADATAEDFLRAARIALVRGQTGEAQEAMERAQTRLLDRSVPLFRTDQPSTHPAIPLISQAIRALGAGDKAMAMQYLDQALPLAQPKPEAK